jgi:hypothetical protein
MLMLMWLMMTGLWNAALSLSSLPPPKVPTDSRLLEEAPEAVKED